MKFSAILLAAGTGSRTNLKENKVFYPIGERAILLHALRPFLYNTHIEHIVIATAANDFAKMQKLLAPYPHCKLILGGDSRIQSVYNCLQYLVENTTTPYVLVHDCARPFLTDTLLQSIITNALQFSTAVPVLPATDSLISLQNGQFNKSLPRQNTAIVQTPQAFPLDKLFQAYKAVLFTTMPSDITHFTDDSSIYAATIAKPHLIEGDIKNKKITYIEDIYSLPTHKTRTGIGQDIHRYAANGNSIVLGGVQIAAKANLVAHSDGDVLVHAIMDALLSASGLQDIGYYFPNTDIQYKNCNSLTLLKQVYTLLQQKGSYVCNLSATILAEHPKLAPHISQMKANIAAVLQIESSQIGITATTAEKLGAIGNGEGIFVTAIATIANIV